MTYIEITWNTRPGYTGSRETTSVSFDSGLVIGSDLDSDRDLALCEELFADTNTYSGSWWSAIQPRLSENRSHTALSVGDDIRIGDNVYRCADIGFGLIEKDGRPYHQITRSHFAGTPNCLRCGALCEDDEDEE